MPRSKSTQRSTSIPPTWTMTMCIFRLKSHRIFRLLTSCKHSRSNQVSGSRSDSSLFVRCTSTAASGALGTLSPPLGSMKPRSDATSNTKASKTRVGHCGSGSHDTQRKPRRNCGEEVIHMRDIGKTCRGRFCYNKVVAKTMYHLYILLCSDQTLYTGIAVDVARRV